VWTEYIWLMIQRVASSCKRGNAVAFLKVRETSSPAEQLLVSPGEICFMEFGSSHYCMLF
jgi:hypothetical protein